MSENDKFPGPPPPDDFSKTTPNINVGGGEDSAQYDWDKTNYNYPKQPAADDWGKTVTNLKPIETENQDFSKTFYPGSQSVPPSPDWGVTNANVKVDPADFGSSPEDFGAAPAGGYDKTTPYFRLPEAERAKYQNLPPTPTEKAEQERREQAQKGGIPTWLWAVAGLVGMFLFAVVVLAFVYFVLIYDPYFQVTVKTVPPGSRILVDDQQLGIASDDGSYKLVSLVPGRKTIKILHPTHECRQEQVDGVAGEEKVVTARCKPIEIQPDECQKFNIGEFDKAELCYYKALGGLTLPPTPDDLVKALNILIINFESSKADIPPERLAALQKGAEYIKQLPPDIVLEVGGHTDNQGGDEINMPLSQRRAEAVKKKLVDFGVRPETLQTRGYGSAKPRPDVDGNTDQGRFFNRRIEYSIVRK